MFSRIKDATRIITYREPATGPDAVIVERDRPTTTAAGKVISHVFELLVVVYALAHAAAYITDHLTKIIPATRSVSLGTIAAAIGVLLAFVMHQLRDDIEQKIRAHINLSELLAPYFGHRIDRTIRVLKG